MLELKTYRAVDKVFMPVAGFSNGSMECSNNHVLTPILMLYLDIVNVILFVTCVLHGTGKVVFPAQENMEVMNMTRTWKSTNIRFVDFHVMTSMFYFGEADTWCIRFLKLKRRSLLNFHMLHHVAEDVSLYGELDRLDVSAFEHFSFFFFQKANTNDGNLKRTHIHRDCLNFRFILQKNSDAN